MHPQLEKKATFQRLVRPLGEAVAWTACPQHTCSTLGAPAGISGCSCYAQRQALSRRSVCVNLKSAVTELGGNRTLHIHAAEP